jgi:hypothetical protein
MNYLFCIKEESQMRPQGSLLLSLSRHRFLAETRSEVSSVVSMTENNTPLVCQAITEFALPIT